MSGRMRFVAEEPCGASVTTLVKVLESIGWNEHAEFARLLGRDSAKRNAEVAQWRDAYWQMCERYEPKGTAGEHVSYRPPSRSSD